MTAEAEVVDFVRDLLRIESVNTGDPASIGDGEARAARYVKVRLEQVGFETAYFEPAPGRGNVLCRLRGSDPGTGGLLLHAHLDVVAANASEWSAPPFGGEIRDGVLYGRGALDMKDMAGMLLAVARDLKRKGFRPVRDVMFAFVADEETGGQDGVKWLVDNQPELFAGITDAIGEAGGFSVTLPGGPRVYLLATAEKGAARLSLTCRGTAGHGSRLNPDNAVTRLADAVAKIGRHPFPIVTTAHSEATLSCLRDLTGLPLEGAEIDAQLDGLGFIGNIVRASLRNTASPTRLDAGVQHNVVPTEASAMIDCRLLPGAREEFVRQIAEIVGPDIELGWRFGTPIESRLESDLTAGIEQALLAEDPDGRICPYLLPAGTDNKKLSTIGINGYGFVPLRVPADFDAYGLFHSVDERVPIDSLRFGVRVLERLLRSV